MIRVSVVVENSSTDIKSLPPRHGLSLLVECEETRLLYDFGPSGALLRNAKGMNIDLSTINLAVLSHSHVDHGYGINDFLSRNNIATVYAMNTVETGFYTKLAGFIKIPVGVHISSKYADRVIILKQITALTSRIHLLDFAGYNGQSTLNKDLLMRKGRSHVPDDFHHESLLVIEDKQELVVFNACSHHGVIESLKRVLEVFPDKRIRSYFGGFHTCNPINGKHEDQQKLVALGNAMSKCDCVFYTGHCTGDFAYQVLSPILGNKLQRMSTGNLTIG